jgi:catechol 2,3-dioxygenase-like lactoylglutathione lyase family enzyme
MLDHISLGVRDLARAGAFYEVALAPLGYVKLFGNARGIGFGLPGAKDEAFAVLAIGEDAKPSAGFHVAFAAKTREAVDAFHGAVIEAGGADEGAPGLRPHYGETYYAAFARDLDGHRIEAVCHG